ncbi:MAG: DUF2796 domain-containing protein [Gammaproteobacteria bacterium]|nr:DUF2796 domain-containing protein [Gammaproteobacteria bacterium]
MSKVRIDSAIVRNRFSLNRSEEKLVEVRNRCVCCALGENLIEIHRLNFIVLTIVFAFVAQSANSAEYAASLDAHLHGLSELNIAMEDEILEIQLTSPAMNILGFAHKASTQEHLAAVASAELQLRKHEALFLFSDGHCEHVKTSIDVSDLIENDNHAYANQKNSIEHEHAHNPEREGHAQHDSHSEIIASYQYRCDNKSNLSAITVNFFRLFSRIHKIHVMWVKPAQQGAVTLTSNNHIIEFR